MPNKKSAIFLYGEKEKKSLDWKFYILILKNQIAYLNT